VKPPGSRKNERSEGLVPSNGPLDPVRTGVKKGISSTPDQYYVVSDEAALLGWTDGPLIKEAILYNPLEGGRVKCTACARYCNIPEGKIGFCGVRQNTGGE